MREEAANLRDCLDGNRKSDMALWCRLRLRVGLMRESELERFSPEFRETVCVRHRGR